MFAMFFFLFLETTVPAHAGHTPGPQSTRPTPVSLTTCSILPQRPPLAARQKTLLPSIANSAIHWCAAQGAISKVYESALEGYTEIRRGGKTALVRGDAAEAIAAALLEGANCTPRESDGRDSLLRFPLGDAHGLIRRYRRGGAMQHVLKDAYLFGNRPRREFDVHRRLEEKGLAVPPLLGVCWQRTGLLLRGAIATQELQGAHLRAWLATSPENQCETLEACGALIRRMHNLHIWHADLQVMNIVITKEGPFLIDFDNARYVSNLSPLLRGRNLLRLRRSFEKRALPVECFNALCAGYGIDALPEWLSRAYHLKGRLSGLLSGNNNNDNE